ncbi:MAG: FAD-linked oxidase C-terminal domain-containing protein [Trueperaceae bacterium]|nr:FAD-linked oxidase C-terminal domain-containing protein [Trueperaceae bacterium]
MNANARTSRDPSSPLDDAALAALERDLRAEVRGEVRFDDRARALYATDASPYEIAPFGVVVPLDRDDVIACVRVCARHHAPVLPRGGGTSLAGQAVGRAVVIDVSKHLTGILEVDPDGRTATVEPGVIRDALNDAVAVNGLQFTPDVSTTNRAAVGGMVANNSAGTRSIKYGKSVDQTLAMTVVLADGSVVRLAELDDASLDAKCAQDDLEGEIHRTVRRIVRDHEDEIRARYPKVMRRVGGYNLDEFTAGRPFNLAKLVAGSEGTLAVILDVTVKLDPVPKRRMLAMLHFASLKASLEAVPFINRHGPSAVELLDRGLFELGGRNPSLKPLLGWLQGMPEAVLMVEFDGADEAEVRRGLEALRADPEIDRRVYHVHEAWSEPEQKQILQFRKDGLGIYATVEGRHKPTPFIEDAAIPPEHLAEYIPAVQALCRDLGVDTVFYGHASVGVIHTRPLLDLKTAEGLELYERISDGAFALVQRYGGSWSGEHGDGLIRSQKNRELFGDRLYEAFRELKAAFDPHGIMNPGKITDAAPMTENLRYGADYPAVALDTVFDFGEDGFLGAVEACTGVGACRKVDVGTMCPSYMATRDEDHSTRGRANVLREALNGRLPGGLTSKQVYDTLDLCLECKACKAECPSSVDMAKLKYEFLQQHHDVHGVPLGTLAIANVARVAPVGRALAPLANALLPMPAVRWMIEKVVGVDRRRELPAYADESLTSWFRRRGGTASARGGRRSDDPVAGDGPRRVALFADTWTMFNDTGPGRAAVRVLEALGYQVELVPYGCCGRPQISKGLLRDAKRAATRNVERLAPYVRAGVPVVGLEPSCVTAFTDDYRDLLPGDDTNAVADHVRMIDVFLAGEWTRGRIDPEQVFQKSDTSLLFHGHCQQKAVMGTAAGRALLGWISDDVEELDAGCCGMAGSFGYGHYDVSMKIGERRLFPAVREHDGETAASGFSCRHQIHDGANVRARHLIELLADALIVPDRRPQAASDGHGRRSGDRQGLSAPASGGSPPAVD